MADVVVTLKVMPAGPDKKLEKIEEDAKKLIRKFTGENTEDEIRVEIEPIGFGLKALKFTFVYDEKKGATDELEQKISELGDVESVEAIDVRRAIG